MNFGIFHESIGITEFTKQTVILTRKSIISKYRFMFGKLQKVICSKSLFLLENACQIKICDRNRLNRFFVWQAPLFYSLISPRCVSLTIYAESAVSEMF